MSDKLSELLPKEPEFQLDDKTYRFKLLSVDDCAYYEEKYGSMNDMLKILSSGSMSDLPKKYEIIYAQLEDKTDFASKDIKELDRDGNLVEKRLSGSEVFRKAIPMKLAAIPIAVFMTAFNKSMPELTDEQREKIKKKVMEAEK